MGLVAWISCAPAIAPAAPNDNPADSARGANGQVVSEPDASRVLPPPAPPVALKRAFLVASPNGARQDDYYWLRDDKRQSPEVLEYLNQENAYRDARMAPASALRKKLRDELIGRLTQDDDT